MKTSNLFSILIVTTLFALLIACNENIFEDNSGNVERNEGKENKKVIEEEITENSSEKNKAILGLEEDMIFIKEKAPFPSYIKNPDEGPWHHGLFLARSEDGLKFSEEKMFLEHAGVANLILTSENILIATFQYFSFINKKMFDVIAYATSEDYGNTWSSVKPIKIGGLNKGSNPVDPTLVELDDKTFRLYFTYHEHDSHYPQLFSAHGDSITLIFHSEGQQLQSDGVTLDPAIVRFDSIWHHYTVKHDEQFSNFLNNIHSVSQTGLDFQLVAEININMPMLGDVIQDEDGVRFYNGENSAFSTDGYDWTIEEGQRVQGADPGVARLPDGSYIMIYTNIK